LLTGIKQNLSESADRLAGEEDLTGFGRENQKVEKSK